MGVRLSGSVSVAMEVQPSKARSPMVVRLSGSVSVVMEGGAAVEGAVADGGEAVRQRERGDGGRNRDRIGI